MSSKTNTLQALESSRSRLTIRRVSYQDVPALSEILQFELKNFPHLPEHACVQESKSYSTESLAQTYNLNSHVMLIAFQGEEIVGFIHATITYDVAWLLWVIVPVKHRKRNKVWYLWKRLFTELRLEGVHKIWGSIRNSNSAALEMASAIGFSALGTAPNFWHGCDYLFVSRSI